VTTTFQLSDKGDTGQAILLVKVEAPDEVSPEAAWGVFVQAVTEAGLADTIDNFDQLKQAQRTAQAGLGATPVNSVPPPAPAAQTWGQPPVPPMQQPPQLPAAAAAPAVGAAPACYHGTKEFISGITKSGKNAGKPWKAWACPADRDDPSKCEKDWIRD
jgi:hypothetical protein